MFSQACRLSGREDRREFIENLCGENLQLKVNLQLMLDAFDTDKSHVLDQVVDYLIPATSQLNLNNQAADTLGSVGPFAVKELLGEGGMGAVYRAEQTHPVQREVALKLIKPGMDSKEVIARFESERQALAMMDHANIARIFEAGMTSSERPYFAMELVRGVPIDRYCDSKKLTNRGRLLMFLEACAAVEHAHQKGIIHRDLKPSNVMVTESSGNPTVKVIDFGIAKAVDQSLTNKTLHTSYTELLGTPAYMSPEQVKSGSADIDTRSDIYSLGVLLYRLLTGVTPFDKTALKAAGIDDLRRIVLEQTPKRPSSKIGMLPADVVQRITENRCTDCGNLIRSLSRELDWIVLRALEKDRRRRYQTATELADDIRRYLDNLPVNACPPSVLYRTTKTLQRHKVVAASSLIIAVILLLSSSVAIYKAIEAKRASAASLVREQQANDLLEVARLQSAMTAFRQLDLLQLAALTKPWEVNGEYSQSAGEPKLATLGELLHQSGRPTPVRSIAHSGAVQDIAVATDGTVAISVDDTGVIRTWNPNLNSPMEILGRHFGNALSVAISPDGAKAVTGDWSGQVWFWDLQSKSLISQARPANSGIETLVWSPDGKMVAAGARYSQIWISDSDGKELFRIENDHRHESLLFSPDSQSLYVPTRDGVDIWNVVKRSRKSSIPTEPGTNIRTMCWLGKEQNWLIAGERYNESLLVFERRTNKRLAAIPMGMSYAQQLAVSPDGEWLSVVYSGGRLQLGRIIESRPGRFIGEINVEFSAHTPKADQTEFARPSVAWMPDSRRFISAGEDGLAHVWNRLNIKPVVGVLPGSHVREGFLLDDTNLVYIHADGAVVRHPLGDPGSETKSERLSFPTQCVARTPGQNLTASAGEEQVAVIDLATSQIITQFDSPFVLHRRIELGRDGNSIVVSTGEQVCVWRTGDRWATFDMVGPLDLPAKLAPRIADNGRTLIVDNDAEDILEVDLTSGKSKRHYKLQNHGADYVLSHDGNLLAASAFNGILVWDRKTGEKLLSVQDLSTPTALQFFPDNRVLVSGHADGKIRAWHIPTGQPLGVLYESRLPIGEPESLSFSETGVRLLAIYRKGPAVRPVILGPIRTSISAHQ